MRHDGAVDSIEGYDSMNWESTHSVRPPLVSCHPILSWRPPSAYGHGIRLDSAPVVESDRRLDTARGCAVDTCGQRYFAEENAEALWNVKAVDSLLCALLPGPTRRCLPSLRLRPLIPLRPLSY